jgi:hypothetical protein
MISFHLIDDIFWNMGFKTETVMSIIQGYAYYIKSVIRMILIKPITSIISIISIIPHYLQVRQDLGLADHMWQDKRTLIAQSVDNLGNQFRPAMRAGWLSFMGRGSVVPVRTQMTDAGPQAIVGEGILMLAD